MSASRPAAVAGGMTSSFLSLLDVLRPSVDPTLYRRYGWDYYMTDLFMARGLMKSVDQKDYSHYEKDHPIEYATAASLVTQNTPSATLTVTLGAADHYNSGTQSYPQAQRMYMTKNRVQVMIIAKDVSTPGAHTITLQPRTGDTIGTIAAGEVLVPVTALFGTGDTLTGSAVARTFKYENQTMIRGDVLELEGEAMASATWFVTQGGQNVYTLEAENDFAKVFRMQGEMAMLLLQKSSTSYTTLNKVIRTTEGLIPWIENQGGGIELLDQEIEMANLDRINRRIIKRGGEMENEWYIGFEIRQQMRKFITDVMKNGAISYGAFNGNKEIGVALGYDSISVDGITHHLKNYAPFNNEKTLGAPGMPFGRYAIIMPYGSANDARTGEKAPYMRVRYRAVPGYSREFEYSMLAGTREKQWQDFTDKIRIGYREEKGFEGFCANKFQIAKPVSF